MHTPVGLQSTKPKVASKEPPLRTWSVWLPAALSVTILVVVAVSFTWLTRSVSVQRRFFTEALVPASEQLMRFQLAFLQELQVARVYVVHPTKAEEARVRDLHQQTQGLLEEFSATATRIGRDLPGEMV